jgi:hypothetical protein
MTTSGKFRVSATCDLGGLGAAQGPATTYLWIIPSFLSRLLPWVILLLAFSLRPNREPSAWWIWLPLGLVVGSTYAILLWEHSQFLFGISQELGLLVRGLAAGVGLLWLLSPYLDRRRGAGRFFGILLVQALGCGLATLSDPEWDDNFIFLILIFLMVICLVIFTVTFLVTGWLCRQRYGVSRILTRLSLTLVFFWLIAVGTVGMCTSAANEAWALFLSAFYGIAISLFVLLPFLVLAFSAPCYRERLKTLLKLARATLASPPSPG